MNQIKLGLKQKTFKPSPVNQMNDSRIKLKIYVSKPEMRESIHGIRESIHGIRELRQDPESKS